MEIHVTITLIEILIVLITIGFQIVCYKAYIAYKDRVKRNYRPYSDGLKKWHK